MIDYILVIFTTKSVILSVVIIEIIANPDCNKLVRFYNIVTYLFFEFFTFLRRQSIGFGNNWNNINFVSEPLHKLHIERLEPVSARSYEV